MATGRLAKIFTNNNVHTKENIFHKLNTDLTDSERKSYLNILFESPDTTNLLTIVVLEWKKKLLDQRIQIEILTERIRVKTCYINAYKESKILDANEKIESMQKSVDQDLSHLKNTESMFEKSIGYAEKSLVFCQLLLEKTTQKEENLVVNLLNINK